MIAKDGNGNAVVHVQAGGGYDVTIGSGLLERAASFIPQPPEMQRVAIVTDDIVEDLFVDQVMASFMTAGFEVSSFVFQHGEASKNVYTYAAIVEHLAARHLTRSDLVAALGGGVVGDLAGFAAATYQRGCKFIQVPTTLLAAVDSSVGGKTGIDLFAGKNLAGAFYQPLAVVCDTDCIASLPAAEFSNGMAEALKYGVLCDRLLFDALQGDVEENLGELIARCVDIKREYVEADEREANVRKFLNLGHTFGHAIEKASYYAVPHGSAVSIGMVMAARLAASRGLADAGIVDEVAAALQAAGLPTSTDIPTYALVQVALSDKKRAGDEISFVLPRAIGECELVRIPTTEVAEVFEAARA